MKTVRYDDSDFEAVISTLETRGETVPEGVMEAVFEIVGEVRRRGDEAVAEYTLKFDNLDFKHTGMELGLDELDRALEETPADERKILEAAADSIRHALQSLNDFYSFIHEQFFSFYFGQRLANISSQGKLTDLADLVMEKELLPTVLSWYKWSIRPLKLFSTFMR